MAIATECSARAVRELTGDEVGEFDCCRVLVEGTPEANWMTRFQTPEVGFPSEVFASDLRKHAGLLLLAFG